MHTNQEKQPLAGQTDFRYRPQTARGSAPLALRFSRASIPYQIQAKSTFAETGNRFESEADTVADAVVAAAETAGTEWKMEMPPEREQAMDAKGLPVSAQVPSESAAPPVGAEDCDGEGLGGAGAALPRSMRSLIEPLLGHDLGTVRLHTDGRTDRMARQIGAHAFTSGSHIGFATVKYDPTSTEGLRLLAHELTHVVQQGAAGPRLAQASAAPVSRIATAGSTVLQRAEDTESPQSGGGIIAWIVSKIGQGLKLIPGWDLAVCLFGYDPLTRKTVERNAENLVKGVIKLVDGGKLLYDKLMELDLTQKALAWVNGQLSKHGLTAKRIHQAFLDVKDEFSIFSGRSLKEIFEQHITPIYDDAKAFALGVMSYAIGIIKKTLIKPLMIFVKEHLSVYPLLTVVLGKDPIIGESVPRTPANFVEGFMSLVPGGVEKLDALKEARVIPKAMAWLNGAVARLKLSREEIAALFRGAWDTLAFDDLFQPRAAFQRIVTIFSAPVGRIIDFAAEVGLKVVEFVFYGLMGPSAKRVLALFKRTKGVFRIILDKPIVFGRNLMKALSKGFTSFQSNITTHLQKGIFGWLFNTMEGAGIQLPEQWDAKGIISVVLQVLGITYARIRARMVARLGEQTVARLESTFDFLKRLITEGPGFLWEKMRESIANLPEMIIDAIKNWVVTRVVTTAIIKIISMFNPIGAIVVAAHSINQTIMFFIDRFKQIMALAEAVVDSIDNIAWGKLTKAANCVEDSMAKSLPVIISFMARFIGLGNISGKIKKIIEKLQDKVDLAINKVIGFIMEKGKAVVGKVKSGVARAVAWWQARKPFTSKKGESHELFFESAGNEHVLMVSSEKKMTYRECIEKITGTDKEQKRAKKQALKIADKIDVLKRKTKTEGKTETESGTTRHTQTFQDLLDELAELTSIFVDRMDGELPFTKVEYGTIDSKSGFGTSMEAGPLTKYGLPGTEPRVTNPIWERLLKRREGNRSYYIRGHLLNHNIHGPGTTWENLTPLSQTGNKAHLNEVEDVVKKAVEGGEIVTYSVTPEYDDHIYAQKKRAEKLKKSNKKSDRVKGEIMDAEYFVPSELICTAKKKNIKTGVEESLFDKKPVKNEVDTKGEYEIKE